MTPEEIVRKYITASPELIFSQKMKDMAEDIHALTRTVHFNACQSMMRACQEKWKQHLDIESFSYPPHPPINMIKKQGSR